VKKPGSISCQTVAGNPISSPYRMLDVIANPYEQRPGLEDYAQPAPREFTACYKTFCGT